jgi:hypothetical protein
MLRFTVVPLTGFEAFGHRSGERRGDLDIHVRYGNQLFIVNLRKLNVTHCQTDQWLPPGRQERLTAERRPQAPHKPIAIE